MARRSANLEAMHEVRREELVADIMRGELTWRALGKKYDVPEATLRLFAERHQIARNPTGAKREMVAAMLAQSEENGDASKANKKPAQISDVEQNEQQNSAQELHNTAQRTDNAHLKSNLEAAAAEDVRDMRAGLQAARMALQLVIYKLREALQDRTRLAPRDVKCLSEANALNIATIRAIRGLDAPPPDMTRLTEEQLIAMASGKKTKQ